MTTPVLTSPDLSSFINLTLYDKDQQTLYEGAEAWMEARVPELILKEGNQEAVLLEALAQIVAEGVYALNRVPGTIVQILLQLFGIDRFDGAQPTCDITFTFADGTGYVIAAGTQAMLDLGSSTPPVIFTTTVPAQAFPGDTTVTVTAVGDRFTVDANGVAAGTQLTLVVSDFFVNAAQLATSPSGGQDPEDTTTWLSRGITALRRLTSTLAIADSFTDAALQDSAVFRAFTIDDYNGGYDTPQNLVATPSASGGFLDAGATYGVAVTAVTAAGETEVTQTNVLTPSGGGDVCSIGLVWAAPPTQTGVGAITGYNIYRTTAAGTALGLVASVSAATFIYDITSATAPTTAAPITNTTGVPDSPGYVTTAVYGVNAPVSQADRQTLQAILAAQALANLNVRVIDATVNVVPVVATVVAAAGFTATQVKADVVAAVTTGRFSTNGWLWQSVLPINQIIAVIGSLDSVAYVQSVSVPSADVTLIGIAPLVQATMATSDVTVEEA